MNDDNRVADDMKQVLAGPEGEWAKRALAAQSEVVLKAMLAVEGAMSEDFIVDALRGAGHFFECHHVTASLILLKERGVVIQKGQEYEVFPKTKR